MSVESYNGPEPEWTHKGWFCFCVPVYWDEKEEVMGTRHWVFDPLFYLMMYLVEFFMHIGLFFGILDEEDCGFPLVITDVIPRNKPFSTLFDDYMEESSHIYQDMGEDMTDYPEDDKKD